MRTAALALAFALAVPIRAQLPGVPGILDPAGLRLPETATVTYLLNETFDSTGYDVAGWTESSASDIKEDYATAPAPLSGTQSLYFDAAVNNRLLDSPAFTASDTLWVSFLFHDDEAALPAAARPFFAIKDSVGGASQVVLTLETDGDLTIACGSATSRSTDSIARNTTYRIWISYSKGTGANATAAVYWSSPATDPKGAAKASVSTGTSTGQAVSVRFVGNTDMEWHLDDVQVAATEF